MDQHDMYDVIKFIVTMLCLVVNVAIFLKRKPRLRKLLNMPKFDGKRLGQISDSGVLDSKACSTFLYQAVVHSRLKEVGRKLK